MTDFALYYCGQWKAGQNPHFEVSVYTVTYDGKTRAYAVPGSDIDGFRSWVAATWASDDQCQWWGESDSDYLDRIGVTIRKVFPD